MNWQRAKIYVGRGLVVAGVIGLAMHPLFMALTAMAYAKAPTTPDRASGHIFPMNNHGFVHYLDTTGQRIFELWPWFGTVGMVAFVAGILLLRGKEILAEAQWRRISRDF